MPSAAVLGSPILDGCAVYSSGQPCPICMAGDAPRRRQRRLLQLSNDDGAPYGLSTAATCAELVRPYSEQSMKISHVPVGGSRAATIMWNGKTDSIDENRDWLALADA